jgi:hypothetical protein
MLRILILLFVFPATALAQVSIKGEIWELGRTSPCNWYFEGSMACMEIEIFDDNRTTTARLIMNADTRMLTIVTDNQGMVTHYVYPADSIHAVGDVPEFSATGGTVDVDGQSCQKFQARTHTHEHLVVMNPALAVNLSRFKPFLKDDLIFRWLAETGKTGFPVQSVSTTSAGELKRSWLMKSWSTDVPAAVFQIPHGSTELKF